MKYHDRCEWAMTIAGLAVMVMLVVSQIVGDYRITHTALPPNTVTCESTCATGTAILTYQCADGPVVCSCDCPPDPDMDRDGDVDLADYSLFVGGFGG